MAVKFGDLDVKKAYLGSTQLTQMFLGTAPLFEAIPKGDNLSSPYWAVRNNVLSGVNGAGNRIWQIEEFQVVLNSTAITTSIGTTLLDAWTNPDNARDNNFTTFAETNGDVNVEGKVRYGLEFAASQEADQFNLYQGADNNSRTISEVRIETSDDGANFEHISTSRVFVQQQPWMGVNANLLDLPTTGLISAGLSPRVVGCLARWPDMTEDERGAMATFLTTLDNANILRRTDEILPLFAQDQATSLKPSHRCGPFITNGSPVHRPGIGWQFFGGTDCLRGVDPCGSWMRYPTSLSGAVAGRWRGTTAFIYDVDEASSSNNAYIVGFRDNLSTNRTYRVLYQKNNDRLGGSIATTTLSYTGANYTALPTGEPITWWRKEDEQFFKWYTDPEVNIGPTAGTTANLDSADAGMAIGANNFRGTIQDGLAATISLVVFQEYGDLDGTDVSIIHDAVITLMNTLGIRTGHTPLP